MQKSRKITSLNNNRCLIIISVILLLVLVPFMLMYNMHSQIHSSSNSHDKQQHVDNDNIDKNSNIAMKNKQFRKKVNHHQEAEQHDHDESIATTTSSFVFPPFDYAKPVPESIIKFPKKHKGIFNINKRRVILIPTDLHDSKHEVDIRMRKPLRIIPPTVSSSSSSAKTTTQRRNSIRFFVIGDFGGPGHKPQRDVAAAMVKISKVSDWMHDMKTEVKMKISDDTNHNNNDQENVKREAKVEEKEKEKEKDDEEKEEEHRNNKDSNDDVAVVSSSSSSKADRQLLFGGGARMKLHHNRHHHNQQHQHQNHHLKQNHHQHQNHHLKQNHHHSDKNDKNEDDIDDPYSEEDKKNIDKVIESIYGNSQQNINRAGSPHVDFLVSTGDSLYEDGAENEYDPKFKTHFENVYNGKNNNVAEIKDKVWFQSSDNHGKAAHGVFRDISGILRHTLVSENKRWWYPSTYYHQEFVLEEENNDENNNDNDNNNKIKVKMRLLIVFIDTYELSAYLTKMSKHQLDWLDYTLKTSDADWKLVVGHRPILSSGKKHGTSKYMQEKLFPIFVRNNVSMYMCGDDHQMQFLKMDNINTNSNLDSNDKENNKKNYPFYFLVSGGGSRLEPMKKEGIIGKTIIQKKELGFASIEVFQDVIKLWILNKEGDVTFSYEIPHHH